MRKIQNFPVLRCSGQSLRSPVTGGMRALPALLLVLLWQAVFQPVKAQSDEMSDALALLQGYEWSLDQAAVASLGEGARQIYLDIANDAGQPLFVRERAATALTLFADSQVQAFFVARVKPGNPPMVRRRSVEALCDVFDALTYTDDLLPLLNESDKHLKVQVARCLRDSDRSDVKAALAAYRAGLSEAWEVDAAGFNDGQNPGLRKVK